MATIGGISVDILKGLPLLKKERVETWVVPGLDGYGAQTLGQGDSEYDLVSVLYIVGANPNDDANTHIDACTALQGTVISLTDDWGDGYTKVLVVKVDPTNAKRPVIYQGVPGVRVEIAWKLVCT